MVIMMTRPTKHPKTGIYRMRKVIPAPLRATAQAILGHRAEIIVSLGTKDAKEAQRLAPAALITLEAQFATLRASAAGEPAALSQKQVQALAGHWYRAESAKWDDNPGRPEYWQDGIWVLQDRAIQVGPDEHEIDLTDADRATARALILEHDFVPTAKNVERVALALWGAEWSLSQSLESRAGGDWRPDKNLPSFPSLAPSAPTLAPRLTFEDVINSWARDNDMQPDATPLPRRLYDRQRTLERLGQLRSQGRRTGHQGRCRALERGYAVPQPQGANRPK